MSEQYEDCYKEANLCAGRIVDISSRLEGVTDKEEFVRVLGQAQLEYVAAFDAFVAGVAFERSKPKNHIRHLAEQAEDIIVKQGCFKSPLPGVGLGGIRFDPPKIGRTLIITEDAYNALLEHSLEGSIAKKSIRSEHGYAPRVIHFIEREV